MNLENKFINIDESDIKGVIDVINKKQLAGTADIVKTYEK